MNIKVKGIELDLENIYSIVSNYFTKMLFYINDAKYEGFRNWVYSVHSQLKRI